MADRGTSAADTMQPMDRGSAPGVGSRRRLAALVLAAALLPATTVALHPGGPIVSLQTILLIYLLIAVVVAFVGGAVAGMAASVAGFLLANWFFTTPFQTWNVDDPENVAGLLVFLVVGTSVGWLVGYARQRAIEADRARRQIEALASAITPLEPHLAYQALVDRVADVFGAGRVELVEERADGSVMIAAAGEELDRPNVLEVVDVDEHRSLRLRGVRLSTEDRRVLAAFGAQAGAALERESLRQEAARAATLAETDRLRTAILNAVSHDLRTPLASIKASVTSLLETGIDWTPEQSVEFFETIRDETERLNRLVGQLLDASRIQVGAVHVQRRPIAPDELVSSAIASLSADPARLEIDVEETLPLVDTDPVLCERVLANLIDNALNHSPRHERVTVTAVDVTDAITFSIIDRGEGIPPDLRTAAFRPFHRLNDTPTNGGVGLGLAVTRGFLDALGHQLMIDDNPGGGTVVRVPIPIAHRP